MASIVGMSYIMNIVVSHILYAYTCIYICDTIFICLSVRYMTLTGLFASEGWPRVHSFHQSQSSIVIKLRYSTLISITDI